MAISIVKYIIPELVCLKYALQKACLQNHCLMVMAKKLR